MAAGGCDVLVPCCERRDPWRNARALSVTPQDTDKAGIENQIRQLKQALITLAGSKGTRCRKWLDRSGRCLERRLVGGQRLTARKLRPIVRRNRLA